MMMSRSSSMTVTRPSASLLGRPTASNSTSTLRNGQSLLPYVRCKPVDKPPSVANTSRRFLRVIPGLTDCIRCNTRPTHSLRSWADASWLAARALLYQLEQLAVMLKTNKSVKEWRTMAALLLKTVQVRAWCPMDNYRAVLWSVPGSPNRTCGDRVKITHGSI